MRMDKGKPFMDVPADFTPEGEEGELPTFSEAFLYPTVGKGDARFILGVAEEYEHIIKALGSKAVIAILQVRPKLVRRLGVGKDVVDTLEDARSDQDLQREKQSPAEVVLDESAAHATWTVLHNEYRRIFNPEEDMGRDQLRAYNALTDGLGHWEQEQRQKERDRLPEKLERQKERRAEIEAKRAAKRAEKENDETLV